MELPDEYQKLVHIMMNTPRVVIDNAACATATVVRVNSARKRGMMLEAVQVLTDLSLTIRKGYISSDGCWFMDVFHVTDGRGRKLLDPALLARIERSLGGEVSSPAAAAVDSGNSGEEEPEDGAGLARLTVLELTGTDRPGLLSEVFAVLRDLGCNVVEAKVWTHSGRIASLIFVKDHHSGSPIADAQRVHRIEARLRNVLCGDHDVRSAKTTVASPSMTHTERRLHQLLFADRDYERVSCSEASTSSSPSKSSVSVQNWTERGYSVVNVQCRDRPKLLFDVVCNLTDMDYIVFHGTLGIDADRAYQEFYIRHMDGGPISSEAERQRVIQCLLASIERRASEGVRLELSMPDRRGLLADVTRTFRENGLSVTRAEITTKNGEAKNEFCVSDTSGQPPDRRTINAVIERIGKDHLKLNEQREPSSYRDRSRDEADAGVFNLGNLVMRNLYYLGLVRSCS